MGGGAGGGGAQGRLPDGALVQNTLIMGFLKGAGNGKRGVEEEKVQGIEGQRDQVKSQ